MKGTMLITGRESALGAALIEQAVAGEWRVVTTTETSPKKRSPRGKAKESERSDESERLLVVPWTRESALSARNVLLRGLSTFDGIDEAIVVHGIAREARPLHDIAVSAIQQGIDLQIKGDLFLVREVLRYFVRKRGGVLSLVLNTEGDENLSALDSAGAASFSAVVKTLIRTYQNEPLTINGFETASSDMGEFASFILSNHWSNGGGGKVHRFTDRTGFRPFARRRKN